MHAFSTVEDFLLKPTLLNVHFANRLSLLAAQIATFTSTIFPFEESAIRYFEALQLNLSRAKKLVFW